jgi:hypothetical protein
MWKTIPVLDDGTGPLESFCDYTEVDARDTIEAKVLAVYSKDFKIWRQEQKDNNESLYKGLKVRKIKEKS